MAVTRSFNWNMSRNGNNNTVYISEDKSFIFKISKTDALPTDDPEHSVEAWNAINPDSEPKAYVYEDPEFGKGWICPFIKGNKPPSRDEIHAAVIDIYNRTGRIALDAPVPGNCIKRDSDERVFLVDVGRALQLEKSDTAFPDLTRRKSIASLKAAENVATFTRLRRGPFKEAPLKNPSFKNSPCFSIFLSMSLNQTSDLQDNNEEAAKKALRPFRFYHRSNEKLQNQFVRLPMMEDSVIPTWDLLQALIVIKTKRPDILNVDFLKNNRLLIERLAKAYQTNDYTVALKALHQQQPDRRIIIIRILEKNHEPGLFGPTSFVDTLSKDIATKMTDKTTYQKYIRTLFKQDKISLRCAIQLNQMSLDLPKENKENKEDKSITTQELNAKLNTYDFNKGYLKQKFRTSTQTIDDFNLLHKIATDGEWKSIDQSCINLCFDAREKRSSFTRNMRFFINKYFINKYLKKRTGDKPYDSQTNIFIESIRPK